MKRRARIASPTVESTQNVKPTASKTFSIQVKQQLTWREQKCAKVSANLELGRLEYFWLSLDILTIFGTYDQRFLLVLVCEFAFAENSHSKTIC